jgi:outer membrane protein OmpA-like peptidoglycan-associated protein
MGQLLESLSTAVPPDQVAALARLLGDTPEATGRALVAAATALLATLATRAAHGEMDMVMALAGPVLNHGNPQDQLAAGLNDSQARAGLMARGHDMAAGLLGPQHGALAGALAKETGARAHTVAELLKIAGPVALGTASRFLGGRPTADALDRLLEAERPALLGALSPALAALVTATAAEQTPLHGTWAEGAAGAARSAGRWLPWLLALVIGIALVASLRNHQSRHADDPAAAPGEERSAIITEAPVALVRVDLPDGIVLMLADGSAAVELARFLGSTDAAPREIRFEDLGFQSGERQPDAAGEEAVRAVARVLQAWPSAAIRIVGHTDAEGEADANLALSTGRAEAVQSLLQADGIAPPRVAHEGLGESRPIATNDTAEGRAQNRRTMIVVMAR